MSTSDHPASPGAAGHLAPAARGGDGHVHLHVAKQDTAAPRRAASALSRLAVLACALAAAALIAASFFEPWWRFWLYAPQYPGGLKLVISLTGVSGDVSEINILNHYIGMKSLADAAQTERRLASYGVAAIAALVVVGSVAAGRKLNKLIAVPAALFPIVFVADSSYWLYKFGHELDPRAPLKIGVFTPQLFGNGQIGQFGTFATPALGFWLAVAGFAAVGLGVLLRRKVCASCSRAETCSATCPRLLVLPEGKRS